jgi:hypothetical protein
LFENILTTALQNTSVKSDSSAKRIKNIRWVIELPRRGLAFSRKTRQICIVTTQQREMFFIQYPGKETARNDNVARPWDFFPRVLKNDRYLPDLSFQDIWEILFEGLNKIIKSEPNWTSVVATLFYRMAFMNDHFLSMEPYVTDTRLVTYKSGKEMIDSNISRKFHQLYLYRPPEPVVQAISRIVPQWGALSFEGFLLYNDLLAWNEDCKYYYRNQSDNLDEWIRNTGRINTLLTHVSIIGHISGIIRFSDICIKFARGKGVAPATRDELLKVCGCYVH